MRPDLLAGVTALILALPALSEEETAALPTGVEIDLGPAGAVTLRRFEHDAIAVEVDGSLDEPVWSEIPLADDYRVLEPDTLTAPPYRTALRFFYTEHGLYLGFDLEQPPDTIVRRYVPRDNLDIKRDNVSFTLDTSGSGRYGYWMRRIFSDGDATVSGITAVDRIARGGTRVLRIAGERYRPRPGKPSGSTDDFSISQLNFQVRYRWQIAPLSDLFIVYTKGDNRRGGLERFESLFRDSWTEPLGDLLVVKLRYRLGS